MHSLSRLMCASAVVLANSASAEGVIEKRVAADTPEKFGQISLEILQDMNPSGRYEFIRPEEKAKVEADLAAIAVMLQKSGSVDRMTQNEKVQLFNTQEHLNGVLTHSDNNRLVCEHRAPVGTTIPRTTCQTVGEIERSRRATNKALQNSSQIGSVCTDRTKC